MKTLIKQTKAFTMIELVFVIVVLGILAALAIPRMDRDIRQEAADSILSDIRYTQHMALSDHVTNPFKSNWQRAFWRVGFENCVSSSGLYLYVGSDKNYLGGIDDIEAATDPANGKKMIWSGADCSNGGDATSSDRIFITHKYGISTFTHTGGCSAAQYIGFDYFGRLHQGFAGASSTTSPTYGSYKNTDCNLTFNFVDTSITSFSIIVEKETGYAHIDGQPDS